MVRTGQTCKVYDPDADLEKEHGKKAQVLFNIKKVHNHYYIESAEIERIKTMTAQERKEFMSKDVD